MKGMRKAVLGAVVAMVVTATGATTAAHADQGDTLRGGCGFDTNQQDTLTNGQNQGFIYVLAESQEASGASSTATVDCWIDVNGYEQPGTRFSITGDGVIIGQQQISFSSVDGDTITECQRVTFADGSTWTAMDGNVGVDCPETGDFPQAEIDLLVGAFDLAWQEVGTVLSQLPGLEQQVIDDVNGVLGELPGLEQQIIDDVNGVVGGLPGYEQQVIDDLNGVLGELSGVIGLIEQQAGPVLDTLNGFLNGGDLCTPITADNKPLFCANRQPVDNVVAQLEQAIALVESIASGEADSASTAATECRRAETGTSSANVYLAYTASHSAGRTTCVGYKISVTAQTTGQPEHVPQFCLTTTGTCVGPIDETVPGTDVLQSPIQVCDQAMTWSDQTGTGQWTDQTTPAAAGNLGCVQVPARG